MATETECSETTRAYATGVVNILAEDFPDLRDPDIADLLYSAVCEHVRNPGRLEFIVDEPFTANWRLRASKRDSRRVTLACWRLNMTQADWERHERLNTALRALSVPNGNTQED